MLSCDSQESIGVFSIYEYHPNELTKNSNQIKSEVRSFTMLIYFVFVLTINRKTRRKI